MDCREFMAREGVRKRSTVMKWLDKELIPGVAYNEETEQWEFAESSRRPHTVRLKAKADANKIRASMVYACVKRHHINAAMYHMSQSEFNAFVADLEEAGLIKIRKEGPWVYYDSTLKSESYRGKTFTQIERLIKTCLSTTAEAAAKGAVTAYLSGSWGNGNAA